MQEGMYEELIQSLKGQVMELPLAGLSDEDLKSSIEEIVFRAMSGQYYPIDDKVEIVRRI